MYRITLLLLATVGMLVLGAGPAPVRASDPAVHIDNFGCTLFDGNFGLVTITVGDPEFVSTSSLTNHAGVAKLTCHATGLANASGKVVKYSFTTTGQLCETNFGLTNDWSEVVTGIGDATLQCRIHKP